MPPIISKMVDLYRTYRGSTSDKINFVKIKNKLVLHNCLAFCQALSGTTLFALQPDLAKKGELWRYFQHELCKILSEIPSPNQTA